jgi:hypothetical protein
MIRIRLFFGALEISERHSISEKGTYTSTRSLCCLQQPEGERKGESELQNEPPVLEGLSQPIGVTMAKKTKKKMVRREYTKADIKELRAHSKAKTPVAKIAKLTKRSVGSLRQKALKLGISLGHRR